MCRGTERDILPEKFFPFESVPVQDGDDILEKDILPAIVPEWEANDDRSSESDGPEIPEHPVIYPGEFPALLGDLIGRDGFCAEHIPEVPFGDDGGRLRIHSIRDGRCDLRSIRLEDESVEVDAVLDGKLPHTLVRCSNHSRRNIASIYRIVSHMGRFYENSS